MTRGLQTLRRLRESLGVVLLRVGLLEKHAFLPKVRSYCVIYLFGRI